MTEPADIVERLRNPPFRTVQTHIENVVSYTLDVDQVTDDMREAAAEITRLRAALAAAKTKLKLYRAQHSGEYIGGMEYGMLLDMINEVLGESKYDR